MKIYKFLSLLFIGITLFILSSCRNSDSTETEDTTPGNLQIKFENGFNNLGDIVLGQTAQTSSNGQKHNFTTLKYIVSNIVLIDEGGKEFKYNYNNPDKGAFIVDQAEAKAGIVYIDLADIPRNNYKNQIRTWYQSVSLPSGTGRARYFLAKAKAAGMAWSWAAGYIFTKLEGNYGSATADTKFMNHCGNMGNTSANNTADLYREITLNLPMTARVTKNIKPSIHILADLNQYLSGQTALTLNKDNEMAMGSNQHLVNATNNLTKMFRVDHVHND